MSSGDGVSNLNGVMWWRGGLCTRSFTLAIGLLLSLCPALLHRFLLRTQMVRANTDGSAKTPATFRFAERFENGEMGARLFRRGVEGSSNACDMRTHKSTSCGLEDCLACTDFCFLCLLLLRDVMGAWLWSLSAANWCWDMRSDKDGVAENPGGGGGALRGGLGRGSVGRLRPMLLCCVLVVPALLSGLEMSADKFCRPGTELKRSGLLLWCSWISSANEGLPPWPPTPGLLLSPPTSTGLLACQVLLRLPSGTGNDPAILESCADRLLREKDRRLEAGLTEGRLPRLGGTPGPPEREMLEIWPRLEEPKLVRGKFAPWAGLAHSRSCSAISWAKELGPAATQPVPKVGVNASFATLPAENWLQLLTPFGSVWAKRSQRLYESPGCGCVCGKVTHVTLLVMCSVERDKAPYLTRAKCMQRESVWRGRGGRGWGGRGERWSERRHKQQYNGWDQRKREKGNTLFTCQLKPILR